MFYYLTKQFLDYLHYGCLGIGTKGDTLILGNHVDRREKSVRIIILLIKSNQIKSFLIIISMIQ